MNTKKPKTKNIASFLVYVTPEVKAKLDRLAPKLGYASRAEMLRRVINDFCALNKA